MKNKNKKIVCNRRAQAHVEMIISFVLFVGFVVFILIFLNPVNQSKISDAVLDATWNKVSDNLSINYNYISLILKNPPTKCFSISSSPINLLGALVTDSSGNLVYSQVVDSSDMKIDNSGGETVYRLYFSDYFNSYTKQLDNCDSLLSNFALKEYSFGLSSKKKTILYEKISELNKSYTENYKLLKKSLGVDNEFDFIVYNESRDILFDVTSNNKIKGTTVLSREIPITVMNNKTQQIKIIFNIRVW